MSITTPLFQGSQVRLGPIDHDNDPKIESLWTHNPAYIRMMSTDPMRPLSVFHIKKKYEALEKGISEEKNLFHFRIRLLEDDRLLGIGELRGISWPNGSGQIRLGIGAPENLRKGYGFEALQLLLHYSFLELNLHRLGAIIPEYNQPAIGLFTKAGFKLEVRRREALVRDGRRWDDCHYGLFADEWIKSIPETQHA